MSGLRAESPSLREDLPVGASTGGLTDTDDPGVLIRKTAIREGLISMAD
jgi:hypothetical protein